MPVFANLYYNNLKKQTDKNIACQFFCFKSSPPSEGFFYYTKGELREELICVNFAELILTLNYIIMKKITIHSLLIFLIFTTKGLLSQGIGPKFYSGFSYKGVDVFQDAGDSNQFYFVPSSCDLVLGETLKNFKTTYWGIGKPFYVKLSTGQVKSVQGAIVSGTGVFDITDGQRKSVLAEIKKIYGISNPLLKKLALKNITVQPIFAENTLEFGQNSDVKFPTTISIGNDFNFLLSTGNNLFGQVVAKSEPNWRVTPNSNFGINVVGEAEFIGAPWKATVRADLSQVWKEVRQKYSASLKIGWFKIGSAEFNDLSQELIKKQIIKFDLEEGSLDNEKYGRQIFEAIRKVLETVNSQAMAGDGYFKFEPNPRTSEVRNGDDGKFTGWWGLSINGAYNSAHFKQSINFEETISYKGRFLSKIPMSLTLVVNCSPATESMFIDLTNSSERCVTDDKALETNRRLEAEAKAKNIKILDLEIKYAEGKITSEQYDKLLALYNQYTFTEDFNAVPSPFISSISNVSNNMEFLNIDVLSNQEFIQKEKNILKIIK